MGPHRRSPRQGPGGRDEVLLRFLGGWPRRGPLPLPGTGGPRRGPPPPPGAGARAVASSVARRAGHGGSTASRWPSRWSPGRRSRSYETYIARKEDGAALLVQDSVHEGENVTVWMDFDESGIDIHVSEFEALFSKVSKKKAGGANSAGKGGSGGPAKLRRYPC